MKSHGSRPRSSESASETPPASACRALARREAPPERGATREGAQREADADDDHTEHVGQACQEEEGHAASRDASAVHAAAVKRPGTEREAARPAGGDDRVRAQLGEA